MTQRLTSFGCFAGVLACAAASAMLLLAAPVSAEEKKPIRFGARADARPMSYREGNSDFRGFAIDICEAVREILKRLYPELEVADGYVEVTAGNRQPMLLGDEVDTVCGAFSVTEGRLASFDFSFLTFVSGASVAAPRKQEGPVMAQESDEREAMPKVVVVADTTTRMAVQQLLGSSVEVEARGSHIEALNALVSGDVDYYFGDRVILAAMIKSLKEKADNFEVGGRFLTYEPYAMPFAKGQDTELRHAANVAIAELYRSKRIFTIYANHFDGAEPDEFLGVLYRLYAIPK